LPTARPSRPAVAIGEDAPATLMHHAPEPDEENEPTAVIPISPKPAPAKPSAPKPALAKPALAKPALAKPALAKPAPAKPAPPEPAASEPAPSEPVPSEPVPSEPVPSEPVPSEPAPSEPAAPEPTVAMRPPAQPAPAKPAATHEAIWEDESISKPTGMRTLDGLIPKIDNPRPSRSYDDEDEAPARKRWPLVVGAVVLAGFAATFALTRSGKPAEVAAAAPVPAPVNAEPKPAEPAPAEKKPARTRPPGPLTARGLQVRADTLMDLLKKVAPNTTYDARVELRKLRRRAEAKPDAAELEAISDGLDAWEDYYLPR
ncbi:MAG: hypothetical protein H6Q89_2272, partial [Myxococcaceae bacterium]|nr:hypothetical protein [Myxococcaceae bacterium]